MNKLTCPHCEQPGIFVMGKIIMVSTISVKCKACGMQVGIPFGPFMTLLFSVSALIALTLVDSFRLKAVLLVGGAIALFIILIRWVPLEPR
jgi:hypothetical protein